jgi:DNA-binding NarL/FixJ family response regulator
MYGLVDVASGDLRWVGDASSILDAVKAADQEAGDEAFDYMEMPAATASATHNGYLIYELSPDRNWSALTDKSDSAVLEAVGQCSCAGYLVRVEHGAAEAS